MSTKMAQAIINTACSKYEKEGVNAIVAVEKNGVVSMMKDTFDNIDDFIKAIARWERGGYKCFYTIKKDEVK